MKRILFTLILLTIFECFSCAGETANIDWNKPDIQLSKGLWELKIFYIAKGTRSEGLHGVLYKNNMEKKANRLKEEIKTDLGEFIYYGDLKDRQHLFSLSGWLPKNVNSIYPSWKKK